MKTVEEVLVSHNIHYHKQGGDYLVKCLNPEHDDNNPSMRIDVITGVFNCFSCGFSGNIYYTYNEIKNETNTKIKSIKDKLSKLMQTSIYIPLGAEQFSIENYRDISLETYKHFEAFIYDGKIDRQDVKDRVVFPIRDSSGIVNYFVARYIYSELKPKYLITPSNTKKILWPSEVEPINNSIILVEGIFDVINLWDKGVKNAVCTFGTSFGLVKNRDKIEYNSLLLDYYYIQGITKIFLMYDSDESGKKAANNLELRLSKKFKTEIINLPDGLDPGGMTKDQVNKLKLIIEENT